jgi:hypothetical protein
MSVYTSPASVLAIAVVFPVLATFSVILRLWARKMQDMPLAVDDFLIAPALVRILRFLMSYTLIREKLATIGLGICSIIGEGCFCLKLPIRLKWAHIT